ncbi:bifunctional metallophosphatase/5'-nucleotidase [Bacillus lacus]|uniref:Bifunctional metallophosphatase/5'-nucleotidase n=1 Tax=Metabacillus lacus TaxID=1983721 RepID=A0A7X2LZR7_9BACI|nr:bifunctional UDP-sugar hydrolase/5'-nucleotidase [Metabacillus lacus]MRX72004.1 bifunctional metallophosphatase/5'-nucleotidase [Metabacillus lacus]
MKETLHIYHTNDLHSHFEKWPHIAAVIETRRKRHLVDNEQHLLFDIGDHVDRSHPITEATLGKANINLLNELNYDAVTIGNNEGITLPHDALDNLYGSASFPVVLSNLLYQGGKRPDWAVPYYFIQLANGSRAAVLGITVYYELFYRLLGWEAVDPYISLRQSLKEVKGAADLIILLSHLGISEDETIAESFPEIDIIIGGHTHHVLPQGKMVNTVLLAGAGKYGQYVGYIAVDFDEHGNLLSKTAELLETPEEAGCPRTLAVLAAEEKVSNAILSEVIGRLDEDLQADWFGESQLPRILAQAVKEWCKTDLCMLNAGLLLEGLAKGPVTKADLHRICPHPINPCIVSLKGSALKEVILEARTERMEHLQLKGLGFRGKVMGRMIFEGIEVETVTLEDGKEHVASISVLGEKLDLHKTYKVATVDMFTLGPLFPVISHAEHKEYFMPEFLRDVLSWKLQYLLGS